MGLVLIGALILAIGIWIGATLVRNTYKEVLRQDDTP